MKAPISKVPTLSKRNTYLVKECDLDIRAVIFEGQNKPVKRFFCKTVTIEGSTEKVPIAKLVGEQRFVTQSERLGHLSNDKSTDYYTNYADTEFLFLFGKFAPSETNEHCVEVIGVFSLSRRTNEVVLIEQIFFDQVNIWVPQYIYETFVDIGLR